MTGDLITPRLRLRPVTKTDVPAIHAALQDWDVVRWLSRVPYPYAISDAEWFAGEVEAGRIHSFAIQDGTGLAGVIGIDPTLGYWLARDRRGQGYATEAGKALLAGHFARPGAEAVNSAYFEDNTGSCRVLTKLGFESVGPTKLHSSAQDCEVPAQAMRLTPTRWHALHGRIGAGARQT